MLALTRVLVFAASAASQFAGGNVCAGDTDATQQPGNLTNETAAWERSVAGSYENRGLAMIDKIGSRWAITVVCDGRHSTYIDDGPLNLERYAGVYVMARYHYVDRAVQVECVRGPCPPSMERRIALESVKIIRASSQEAAKMERSCRVP